MKILAIESSCDETSIALLEGDDKSLSLDKHIIASQVETHAKYGGVVPEVAARKHIESLQPLLEKSIGKKGMEAVDMIAVTQGPGLITSLMVGVQAAKTLSMAFNKPLIGVNHMEAHVYANWLTHKELQLNSDAIFPSLVLIISGGHTMFVLMKGHGRYELLGETVDDAAGEAFDKVAKLLKLGYPGGPIISKLAEEGDPSGIEFPRPMMHDKGYAVSFSGLKTAVLYYLERQKEITKQDIPNIAASFQQAVIDVLIARTRKAIEEFAPRSIMLAGGVAANKAIRATCQNLAEKKHNIPFFAPDMNFTGDNAAMIATAAYYRRSEARTDAWKDLHADAQIKFI